MSSATALLADAETAIKAGDWDAALEQLESLKQGQPSQPEVYDKLAHVLSVRGKFQSVISTYLEMIQVLVETDQLEHADGVVTRVLALKPENSEARERRIEIENKRGNVARAVYLSRELARLCIDQGDGERSIRLLQDALKHEPGNLDIALELAEMFVSHGHIQDGANQYRKVANAFQEAGNITKAAEAYRRMKVVQSDDPEVLLTLGRLYTELGKLDEAEQEFRSVLRHDLDHEQALMQLGLVCQLKGRFRSGILAFNKVLQNNPGLVAAKRKLGELHHSQGMMQEAVDFFLQAAQGHLEAEERDDAVDCFQIVLSVDENNGPAQQGLTNLGAPVKAKVFEPPTPPHPPEEVAAPEPTPPPPPVPFASQSTPEPVGGSAASESTGMAMDTAGQAEPPKPETAPKRPLSSGLVGGATGGKRLGLGPRMGLTAPGGDKPMLGGGRPTLGGRPGLVRPGLGQKSMGGMMGAGGDKPMLSSPGDRRPQLGAHRGEPQGAAPQPVAAQKPSFHDQAPLEEFSTDLAPFENESPLEAAAELSFDDDFSLPVSPFLDEAGSGTADSQQAVEQATAELFEADFPTSDGPKIGAFSFDSDDDGDGGGSGLRPSYAQEAPLDFGEELADDLFDFDADPSGPQPSAAPVLGGGIGVFDDDSGSAQDDLFGGQGDGDDLFGGGEENSLFGQQESSGDLTFDDSEDIFGSSSPAAEGQPMFEGGDDPFENLFDGADADGASDTIGGSGSSSSDLFFDDAADAAPLSESAFDNLFDEPTNDAGTSITPEDDLFGGAASAFDPHEGAAPEMGATAPGLDAGLFSGDSDSNDLFGDDDLFGGPPEVAESDDPSLASPAAGQGLFESDASFAGDDLFSDESDTGATLFDTPGEKEDEFASSGLFEQAASDDLFGSGSDGEGLFGGAEQQSGLFEGLEAGGDLFGGELSGDDLFGGDEPFAAADAASTGDTGSFGEEFSATAAPTEAADEDLFGGLEAGSDTLFGDFDSEPEAASMASSEAASEGSLFEADMGGELFDEPPGNLFAEETPPSGDSFFDGGDDLFGEFSSSEPSLGEHESGEPHTQASDAEELFGEAPVDDGALFNIPLGSVEENESAGASLFEEPEPIDIPDPMPAAAPEAEESSLFGESGEDLFAPVEADEPPPLDLDLPMPGDAPLLAAQPAEVELVKEAESDLFASSEHVDAPLDFEIPEPSDEPASSLVEEPETDFSSVVEEPDLMDIFDSTMPEIEVEAPLEVEIPEPESLSIAEQSQEESFEGPTALAVSMELLEPSFEPAVGVDDPEPVFEDIVVAEPDPADLLSAEEKEELAQIALADALDEQHAGSDAASKIAAYRKALEENPENLVLRTRLADIHLRYGLLEDAVVQYRQVMRRNPDSIPLLHRVIQAEFWNENYVEAGDSLLALAKLHLKRGEQHEALDTLQSVLSLDPLHFEARKELVSVFTALDDSKLAAHHLRQLAETALTKGEVDGAISAFQQLLEISDDPTFEERLAQIYEGQGDVVRALSSFQNLVGRYRTEERWEEAARVTERIVELDPDLLQEREALIALYQHLGHQQQAVEQQFQLARRYQERGDVERAIGLYEEVLKVQTDNHDARRHLVDAYLDGGRVAAALEQAEALTEHYLDTKNHTTAIYLYSRLVDADPENVELQERLVKFYGLAGDPENAKSRWIHISHLHEQGSRFDRAAEAVQKALELDENQLDLQYRLALLYAERLEDNQSALAQLRKLFQMAPERTEAVKMYIDLLLREEQVSEAGQVLQRLDEAGGEGVEIKANVIASLKAGVESNPNNLKARFNYGELCYHLGDLDHAIEQFQQTRRHPDYELLSYNMLGLCFASKRGYMMLDLAIKQFQKGLEVKSRPEQDYLEIRYNLAMVLYQNGRAKDALSELKECYNVDIAYRDVRSWIQKIEGELASGS